MLWYNATIRNNTIVNNTGDGIYLGMGGIALIEKNYIGHNDGNGINSNTFTTNIESNYITGCRYGISGWFSVVSNNTITKNEKGIFFKNEFKPCTIINNTITNNTGEGILMENGQYLGEPYSCVILQNNIISFNFRGVSMEVVPGSSCPFSLLILNNKLEGNFEGILMRDKGSWLFEPAKFMGNIICNSISYGINITQWTPAPSAHFLAIHNIFWNNGKQAYQNHSDSPVSWNLSGEGNYWSDWQWPDNNHDGIVDLPYEIAGDAGAKDYYPLTYIPRGEPTAPVELKATAANGFVFLEWKEPFYSGVSDITHYNIYRATEPEAWEHIGNSSALNYTDRNVRNGITYYYYVTAVNSNGESRKSNIVNATPGEYPGVPENVSAIGFENKIVLRWQLPADSGGLPVTGYEIYRSIFPTWQGYYVRVGNVTEFVDMDVAENTTYYYRIAAVNEKGSGAQSGVVQATTSRLNLSLVAGKGVLGNGENTTITVYVERNATHEPLAKVHVILSMVNLTGMLVKTEGYTNESGIFTTAFVAGTVMNREEGVLKATVFCANYSVVSNITRITLLPAPKLREMKLVLEADGKAKDGRWKSCVQVLDAENGVGIPNATVELRIARYGIAVEKTTDGQGKAWFELNFSQGEPGFEVEVEIVARKAGYLNASITVRTVLEFESRQELATMVSGIAAGIVVAGAIAAFVVWKRRRKVRRY
ncbi:MAG: NosD domain-containing protein, partial [Thermoplasmata archaeon]